MRSAQREVWEETGYIMQDLLLCEVKQFVRLQRKAGTGAVLPFCHAYIYDLYCLWRRRRAPTAQSTDGTLEPTLIPEHSEIEARLQNVDYRRIHLEDALLTVENESSFVYQFPIKVNLALEIIRIFVYNVECDVLYAEGAASSYERIYFDSGSLFLLQMGRFRKASKPILRLWMQKSPAPPAKSEIK